uniref:ARAD1C11308p n=1 Tax=Blastobotrys adeninivorans TaxID=409370 RepID=A0A060T0A1_BLAAD
MKRYVSLAGQQVTPESIALVVSLAVVGIYMTAVVVSRLLPYIVGICVGAGAAIGGVALYSVYYTPSPPPVAKGNEHGIQEKDRVHKTYAFLREWEAELVQLSQDKPLPLDLFPESFLVSDSLQVMVEYVIRDFVLSWFRSFSSDTAFPAHVDNTIRHALTRLGTRVSTIQWADVLVRKILPVVTDHFECYLTAHEIVIERSVRRQLTPSRELDFAVAAQYEKSRPHGALSAKNYDYEAYRKRWLIQRMSPVIEQLLDEQEAQSPAVVELVKNIVSGAVLFPVLTMLSDPDFWNQMVIKSAKPTLQDQQKVAELRHALDAHMDNAKKASFLKLGPSASIEEYEKFMRAIKKCDSPAEAKQLRFYISLQLNRSQRESSANPLYITRLQKSKQAIEKRINDLSGGNSTGEVTQVRDPREDYKLKDVLNDPACSLVFMEYMDQRKRTWLIQFYMTVNTIRRPGETDEDDGTSMSDPLGVLQPSTSDLEAEESEEMVNRNDIIQIYHTYFASRKHSIINDQALMDDIEQFATAQSPTVSQYKRARQALKRAQTSVAQVLADKYLEKFKQSDLFIKFLASTPRPPQPADGLVSTIDTLQMDSVDELDPEYFGSDAPVVGPQKARDDAFQAVEEAFTDIMKTSSRPALFEDEPIHSDYGESEDEKIEQAVEVGENMYEKEIHLAAPGDLGLTEAVNRLSTDIERLYGQQRLVESLLRKAELTNNQSEMRILNKSYASLDREIQRKELQRQQYIVQESDNSLYGRSSVQIESYITGTDNSGQYILYIIEVQKYDSDGIINAGWMVSRRYSQFLQLHKHLRSRFPQVQKLDFPKKRVVLRFQQKLYANQRRIALERYLKELLGIEAVCRSKAFRLFLSSETFSAQSLEDDVAFAEPGQTATGGDDLSSSTSSLLSPPPATPATSASLAGYSTRDSMDGLDDTSANTPGRILSPELDVKPFVQPICDAFIQVFGLNRGTTWLRGHAVVVILQQLLGGTVEKKIREVIAEFTSMQKTSDIIQMITDAMWPGGQPKPGSEPRSGSERANAKHEARTLLHRLIWNASSRVVGSKSAKYAATHVFAMYQNELLNAHLAYSILDVILDELFPPLH